MCTNLRLMKDSYGFPKYVPCKYLCTECRNMRREDFVQRIKFEYKKYGYLGAFISLTYRTEDLPILLPYSSAVGGTYFNGITPELNSTLYRPDLSRFTDNMQKRLRRKFGHSGKYIGFGDYGSETHRPHYHLIYVGCPVDRRLIYDTWKLGNVDVKPINNARIRYVLNYINKDPIFPDSKFEMYGDYEPPFYHFSKGLGFDEIIRMYNAGQVDEFGVIKFDDSGHKYIIPKYVKDKLGLLTNHDLYSDSVKKWASNKGFSDLEDALKNRSKVVERCNIQSVVASGKMKQDYRKAEESMMHDRLNRFNGFTDYDFLDSQIGFVV